MSDIYNMDNDIAFNKLAEFFKVFGDSSRIKILYSLLQGEKCVIDISEEVQLSQSAVSHQLQLLRSNRLVRYRKEGKLTLYSLDDDHIFSIINQGIEHIEE